VRAFAQLVIGVFHPAGDPADSRPAPLRVQGVGVLDKQVSRACPGRRVMIGLRGQVQPDPVAVGEPVLVALGIGPGGKAQRLVVSQGPVQTSDAFKLSSAVQ
jgi:hypothetical protein